MAKSFSESVTSTTSLSYSSSFSLVAGCDEVASSSAMCWEGSATLGMPSGIRVVVRVPSGMGPVVRKSGAATLIWCRRGFLALMMHFGAWKLLEIGM